MALYPFRYDADKFQGLPATKFIRRCVPKASLFNRYQEQYFDGLLDEAINSRGTSALQCPAAEGVPRQFPGTQGQPRGSATTVAMTQNLLLAEPADIDHIVERFGKSRPTARSWPKHDPPRLGRSERKRAARAPRARRLVFSKDLWSVLCFHSSDSFHRARRGYDGTAARDLGSMKRIRARLLGLCGESDLRQPER